VIIHFSTALTLCSLSWGNFEQDLLWCKYFLINLHEIVSKITGLVNIFSLVGLQFLSKLGKTLPQNLLLNKA
jgi:hypothetical protein